MKTSPFLPPLEGKTALITGGTMGIGLASALALTGAGVRCLLTYKWGGADDGKVLEAFRRTGGPVPRMLPCDVGNLSETEALAKELLESNWQPDFFVSNAAFARGIHSVTDLSRRGLHRAVQVSAWPVVAYLDAFESTGLPLPSRVVAISSPGPDKFCARYDEGAAAKAVLESLCRTLSRKLPVCRVFVVRAGFVDTESSRLILGEGFREAAGARGFEVFRMEAEDIGLVVRALCGDHCNGLHGKVITVDRGALFAARALDSLPEASP